MFELVEKANGLSIGVFGVGGCGCNTINHLYSESEQHHQYAKFYTVNTDKVVLEHSQSDQFVLIGAELTHGYGAGADPDIGLLAAQESEAQLLELITQCDILLCATGLGGGTGTGSTPFIAKLAREQKKPVICIATLPFSSEGELRHTIAQSGLDELKAHANAVVALPNDQLLTVLGNDVGLFDAFKHSNQILHSLIKSMIDMLCYQGLINVDLNDFIRVMDTQGDAVLGVGKCNNENELQVALEQALANPLVRSVDMTASSGVIIQINCKEEISLGSYNIITDTVRQSVSPSALVICGASKIQQLEMNYEILIIATGADTPLPQETNSDEQVNKQADELFDIPAFIRKQAPAPVGK